MKRFLILAALAIAPAVMAGCTCERNEVRQICPQYYPQPACPPVAVAPRQVVQQPVCPLPTQTCPIPAAPTYAAPMPVGGQVTYAQPIQVSGANTVQYFNPYVQPRVVLR